MDPAIAAAIIGILGQAVALLKSAGVSPEQLKAAQDETARLEAEALARLAEIEPPTP